MPFFDNDDCQLHYEEYGHGAPLLLVHGLGSSTRDWEYQIPELARHYRVIALDMRGHGRSDKPRERYSIQGFAEDVAALIEHLQLPPVHLVGISMGGMVGFQLLAQQPELALPNCDRAVELDPTGASHDGRGIALSQLGRYEEALARLGRAVELAQECGDADSHDRWLGNLACCLETLCEATTP